MNKIAIACQGGGSQTAFTAGVLRAFFENGIERRTDVVSLSGTSGGAICAALAWYGMLKKAHGDPTPIPQRILEFWNDLAAQPPIETAIDNSIAVWMRMFGRGILPHFELSPESPVVRAAHRMLLSVLPRLEFTDLQVLLEKHISFREIKSLVGPESPVLLVGAADVLTGKLKKFNSRRGEISVQAILASAAVPMLFPPVRVGDHYYWDGLLSDNPPVQELIRARSVGPDRIPDEIWVIQINPDHCKTVPSTTGEIIDRRNQMEGNVTLAQNLRVIELVNLLLQAGTFSAEVFAKAGITRQNPIEVRFIRMSEELSDRLDYVSKLTRGQDHIHMLMAEGEKQGRKFLKQYLTQSEADDGRRPTRGTASGTNNRRLNDSKKPRRRPGPKLTRKDRK